MVLNRPSGARREQTSRLYATISPAMISLSEFLEINHEVILFVYGLVFFVLGFAIILQVRQSSRLDLARSLRWLAAFGITNAFNEWGDLFIPNQASYLSVPAVQFLYSLQITLLAVSFVCLFEFGVAILHPLGRSKSSTWKLNGASKDWNNKRSSQPNKNAWRANCTMAQFKKCTQRDCWLNLHHDWQNPTVKWILA